MSAAQRPGTRLLIVYHDCQLTSLARHFGLTDEELDFIINYDIKYRMGKDNEEG